MQEEVYNLDIICALYMNWKTRPRRSSHLRSDINLIKLQNDKEKWE